MEAKEVYEGYREWHIRRNHMAKKMRENTYAQ